MPARRLRVAVIADDPVAEVDASVRDAIGALADFLRAEGVAVGATDSVRPVDSAESWEVYLHLLRAATGARLDDAGYAAAQAEAAAPRRGRQPLRRLALARQHDAATATGCSYDERRARLRQQWAAFFERTGTC